MRESWSRPCRLSVREPSLQHGLSPPPEVTTINHEALPATAEDQIRMDLVARHGPLLSGDALRRALGYPTLAAMRQSIARETFPVPTFLIDGRRGRFALTWDVARWLATRAQPQSQTAVERAPSRSRGPPKRTCG